jgi:hypothetical protein
MPVDGPTEWPGPGTMEPAKPPPIVVALLESSINSTEISMSNEGD